MAAVSGVGSSCHSTRTASYELRTRHETPTNATTGVGRFGAWQRSTASVHLSATVQRRAMTVLCASCCGSLSHHSARNGRTVSPL